MSEQQPEAPAPGSCGWCRDPYCTGDHSGDTADPAESPRGRTAPRVEQDTATAKTLITGVLLAELGRRLYEYENAITWDTSCTRCAVILDSAYAEIVRREEAEAKLAAIEAHRPTFRYALACALMDTAPGSAADAYRAALDTLEDGGDGQP